MRAQSNAKKYQLPRNPMGHAHGRSNMAAGGHRLAVSMCLEGVLPKFDKLSWRIYYS